MGGRTGEGLDDMHNSLMMTRVARVLFATAILVGSVSVLLSEVRLGTYGLIHGLSPAYFVSIFLLTISFLITVRYNAANRLLLFAHLLVVTVLLYAVAGFLEGTARFPYVYHVYGHTDFIIRQGSIDTTLTYQSWPALQYFGASAVQLLDLSPTSLLMSYPIIMKLLTIPLLYLLLRLVLKDQRFVWIALWLYLVAGWVNQQYYTAHSFGYFAFLLIIFLMVLVIVRKLELGTVRNGALFIVFALVFGAVITGHLLSSIVALACLGTVYILLKTKRVPGFSFLMPGLLAALLALWLLNPAGYLFDSFFDSQPPPSESSTVDGGDTEQGLAPVEDGTFPERPPLDVTGGATRPYPTTPWEVFAHAISAAFGQGAEHSRVMYVKASFTAAFTLLALLGLLWMLARRRLDFRLGIVVAILSGLLASMLIVGNYSGEIVSRIFSYALPFLAVFAAMAMRSRVLAVVGLLFIFVAPLLFVVAAYGNEKFDYIAPVEIAATEHFHQHAPENSIIYSLGQRIWDMRNIEGHSRLRLTLDGLCRPVRAGESVYVVRGQRDIEAYEYMVRPVAADKLDQVHDCRYYAQVYSSEGFGLFRRQGA